MSAPDTFGHDGSDMMTLEDVKEELEQLAATLAYHIGVNRASDWLMDLSGDVLDLVFEDDDNA